MANKKEDFEPFDFYRTGMGFYWSESSFLWRNSSEEFLKLSDYGLIKQDISRYEQLIKLRREEAAKRHKIYEHRSNFFKVLSILFLIYVFYYIIGYFNDFMRGYDILYNIFCYPVYLTLIYVAYKYAYPFLSFVIESTQEKIEYLYKYPNCGHPDGYDPRVEKYFNDLLWILKDYPLI